MIVEKYEYEKGSNDAENFRDSLSSIDESGKRKWIYPKMPKGWFYDKRKIVSYFLIAFLFAGPFIKIGDEPLLMINVLARKFVILGQPFWPQDFIYFGLGMLAFIVFIILFTVIYGRLFCGWVCPQTIFMEMVFRRIEYWIEGSDSQQKKLNAAPWKKDKIIKKTSKHILFFAISFLIGNTFLAYIIGIDELKLLVTAPLSENMGSFVAMIIFSFMFYFVFSYMREQVCIAVCPYGRLQGVLLDKNSIAVMYDFERGEPRGRIKKERKKVKSNPIIPQGIKIDNPIANIQEMVNAATNDTTVEFASVPSLGDCIDCDLCVKVCPTGIDIRNGTQLECVNCTACMDACDEVMVKVNRPKGLIRYASQAMIEEKKTFEFTTRMKSYTVVLSLLIGVLFMSLSLRSDMEVTILRAPGMLYQEVNETTVSNLYTFQIVNKTNKDLPIELKIKEGLGTIKLVGKDGLNVNKQGMIKGAFFVEIDKKNLHGRKNDVHVEIWSGDKKIDGMKTNFNYK
jgi:polyferredoxin